uniref:Endo/exonuclease/phosphatase domain-containing protein n=1 Tax=Angiostrongylus cantonensis TaxID=6313 RepID=A0A0K0DKU1_ANGCA
MIRYDVIGLAETRRRHPFNAVYDAGEERFFGTYDIRGVGGVGVLVNTSLSMNIDSFEQLTTRNGRLRLKRCGSTSALTVFVVYAPTSNYDEEVEAFYIDLERFYREDHTFFKVISGDFNAKIGPRRSSEEPHIGTYGLEWNEQESPNEGNHSEIDHIIVNTKFYLTDLDVVPKIYTGPHDRLFRARFYFSRKGEKVAKFKNRGLRITTNWELFNSLVGCWEDAVVDKLTEHLHVSTMKGESSKVTKRRLSPETVELIRQLVIAQAAGNRELTSELAKQCREAIKNDFKERRAAVMVEAAEAERSIGKAHRSFANYMTKMIALRLPDGTITASRKAMEKIIHEYYSDLFYSHLHLP